MFTITRTHGYPDWYLYQCKCGLRQWQTRSVACTLAASTMRAVASASSLAAASSFFCCSESDCDSASDFRAFTSCDVAYTCNWLSSCILTVTDQLSLFYSSQRKSVKGHQPKKMSLELCLKLTATDGRGAKVKWQRVPDNWRQLQSSSVT